MKNLVTHLVANLLLAATMAGSSVASEGTLQHYACDGFESMPDVTWSSDRNYILASGLLTTCILDLRTGQMTRRERDSLIGWQPQSHRFTSVLGILTEGPYTLAAVDAESRAVVASRQIDPQGSVSPGYSSDGNLLLWETTSDKIQVLHADDLTDAVEIALPHEECARSAAATWVPETHRIVSAHHCATPDGHQYKRLRIIDADQGAVVHSVALYPSIANRVHITWPRWSPDGSRFALAINDFETVVGDTQGNLLLEVQHPHSYKPTWSPQGNLLALLTGNNTTIVDIAARSVWELDADAGWEMQWLDAESMLLPPDSAGRVSTIDVRNGTRKLLYEVTPYGSTVSLSPDRAYVAVVSGRNQGLEILRIRDGAVVVQNGEATIGRRVQWAPDSRSVAFETGNFEFSLLPVPAE